MDFETLKSSSSNFDKLTKALETNLNPEDQSNKNKYQDDRFWKPELDKTGNGYAVIRFLPAVQGEELPWQRVWSHAFQGPGGWYIENSLTTLNQKDPVSEYNSELWNNGTDAGKEQARKQKRRLKYFSNILVVKDPANPQNEGKVFLYQYGKKIWDKINDLMQPEFEDETPVNPFDFWEGADFKLKIRNVEGYRNYDKSEFDSPSELFDGDDEQLETVYNSLNSLSELVAPDKFKSYDELKQKLDKVLGLTGGASVARPAFEEVDEIPFDPTPQSKTADAPKSPVATAEDDD